LISKDGNNNIQKKKMKTTSV